MTGIAIRGIYSTIDNKGGVWRPHEDEANTGSDLVRFEGTGLERGEGETSMATGRYQDARGEGWMVAGPREEDGGGVGQDGVVFAAMIVDELSWNDRWDRGRRDEYRQRVLEEMIHRVKEEGWFVGNFRLQSFDACWNLEGVRDRYIARASFRGRVLKRHPARTDLKEYVDTGVPI